ncbi:sigma factor [Streptomyces sp. NPDC048269]|uniref:sigma factor n=1 Tax=Streptomyces sp. NPDC048269 TaxID=3155753 RepID=UPI00343E92CB
MANGDRGKAEAILQETFLRAWQNPRALVRGPEHGRPWLFTVARRIAIDHFRMAAARVKEVGGEAQEERESTQDPYDEVLAAHDGGRALGELPPHQREVLVHLHFNDLTAGRTGRARRADGHGQVPQLLCRPRSRAPLGGARTGPRQPRIDPLPVAEAKESHGLVSGTLPHHGDRCGRRLAPAGRGDRARRPRPVGHRGHRGGDAAGRGGELGPSAGAPVRRRMAPQHPCGDESLGDGGGGEPGRPQQGP